MKNLIYAGPHGWAKGLNRVGQKTLKNAEISPNQTTLIPSLFQRLCDSGGVHPR